MSVFLTFLTKKPPRKGGIPWGISRDTPPPPPESVRTFARSVVRWRHNQIFSAWWVTNFSYPWCFAGALRALKLRYKHISLGVLTLAETVPENFALVALLSLPLSFTYFLMRWLSLDCSGSASFLYDWQFVHYKVLHQNATCLAKNPIHLTCQKYISTGDYYLFRDITSNVALKWRSEIDWHFYIATFFYLSRNLSASICFSFKSSFSLVISASYSCWPPSLVWLVSTLWKNFKAFTRFNQYS